MKKLLALTAVLLTIATQAFALDLTSAKKQGLVGEKPDGMIAAVAAATPDVQKLVTDTNEGRLAVYKDTASKQGISVDQVQALAAQKLMNMAGSGEYVMLNGSWVKK